MAETRELPAGRTTFTVRVERVSCLAWSDLEEGKKKGDRFIAEAKLTTARGDVMYVDFETEGEEREKLMADLCRGEKPEIPVHVTRMLKVGSGRW